MEYRGMKQPLVVARDLGHGRIDVLGNYLE